MNKDYVKIKLDNEDLEVRLLLEAIYLKYGYDFRKYSLAHMKRRIIHRMNLEGTQSISELQHRIIYDEKLMSSILSDFSINVTEMFRDPSFYKAFRHKVIPVLRTYPFIRIWHAGCSTGEEVYSMAILLKEEGIYDKAHIYATDFNKQSLQRAQEGIYPIGEIESYNDNYFQSGGNAALANYYVAKYDSVLFNQELRKRITFADHNLVTDGVFGEMHVIVCRNVLIYFNRQLQDRVINLFSESLVNGCFLCLGSKESINFSASVNKFNSFVESEKIYQKKYII